MAGGIDGRVPLEARVDVHLPRAIVDAVELWVDPRYKNFLSSRQPGQFEESWFAAFQARWNVARTIRLKSRNEVRLYFDKEFRQALSARDAASTIDEAAEHIRHQGWSSRQNKKGERSRPVSIVSKAGFLLSPRAIVPYDSFALKGLNMLRGKRTNGGLGHLEGGSYSGYLEAFDSQLERFQSEIERELKSSWAILLADRLGCAQEVLQGEKFQRKVFDSFLMRVGGWEKPS